MTKDFVVGEKSYPAVRERGEGRNCRGHDLDFVAGMHAVRGGAGGGAQGEGAQEADEWLFPSIRSRGGTEILPFLAHPDIFIKQGNDPKLSPIGKALFQRVGNDNAIALMIAGNFGRPGGACIDYASGAFLPKPSVKTQEESLLTFLAWKGMGRYENPTQTIRENLSGKVSRGFFRSWMRYPNNDPTDFLVWNGKEMNPEWPTKGYVDIRYAEPDLYEREHGFFLKRAKRTVHSSVYLSFVAGPNCGPNERGEEFPDWTEQVHSRPPKFKRVGAKTQMLLGTTYRTIAFRARSTHDASMKRNSPGLLEFKAGVQSALYGSLLACAKAGCKRVIVAGVSKGIYAGPYQQWIDRCYFGWFMQALTRFESERGGTPFTQIFVPVSAYDDMHFV